ncbi:hypothetical protein ACVGVM_26105 [Pseudonocardia bannensis]|uniref:Dentin sialophosphoprotein n=1 Tax=Pseudonocardia bannensis TaxID=630973 RepID=A0A848DQV9_9PSEU|nr:hypothetical protein [Pseudonocardia bannensis]NMH95217.1 hypothetical protein [Pseudonocardia bannensis]
MRSTVRRILTVAVTSGFLALTGAGLAHADAVSEVVQTQDNGTTQDNTNTTDIAQANPAVNAFNVGESSVEQDNSIDNSNKQKNNNDTDQDQDGDAETWAEGSRDGDASATAIVDQLQGNSTDQSNTNSTSIVQANPALNAFNVGESSVEQDNSIDNSNKQKNNNDTDQDQDGGAETWAEGGRDGGDASYAEVFQTQTNDTAQSNSNDTSIVQANPAVNAFNVGESSIEQDNSIDNSNKQKNNNDTDQSQDGDAETWAEGSRDGDASATAIVDQLQGNSTDQSNTNDTRIEQANPARNIGNVGESSIEQDNSVDSSNDQSNDNDTEQDQDGDVLSLLG